MAALLGSRRCLASAAARQGGALRARAAASAAVPDAADVVIIGGGVAGCAAARALAARGASVVLLEQNSLTSGSTWHAAGLLGTLKGSSLLQILATYGNETYRSMNDPSTGASLVGWTNTGSLGIARCADSMEMLTRQLQMARSLGIFQHRLVSASEIEEIHPFLNVDGIVGGVYSPEDGICNPADVALMMAKEARASGARVFERTPCAAFDLSDDRRRIVAVRTAAGERIACGQAVLCGGAWTKELSRLAFGENRLPVAMVPHQYVIFDKTEGVGGHLPVTRDIHHKYYLKPEVGGFMVGVFEGEPIPHFPQAVRERNANVSPMPREAEHEVYGESFDKMGPWLEAAMEHVPALQDSGIKQCLHGPDTHSVDHSPLIGRVPGADNCFVATGFNSQGIQCGPGAGLALAEYILDGAPHSLGGDFSSADPCRVFTGLCEDSEWVEHRAAEGYGKTYSIHFPYEIFESARGRRFSPLHADLEELGTVFSETYGWERPLYFPRPEERVEATVVASPYADPTGPSSPAPNSFSFQRDSAEYFAAERRESLAARESAALFDLSSFGKLRVTGPRSLETIQMCMTAEMDRPIGSVTYTLFCDVRGGILGDLTVTRLGPEEFYLVTLAAQPGKVTDHLLRVAAGLEIASPACMIEDVTEANAVLAVNGPKSRQILAPLTNVRLDNDSFEPGTAQRMLVAGVDLLALRVSFAGELGWELHCPAASARKVNNALMMAGASHGLVHAGYFALLNCLRMEKGFVHYGGEISLTETPLEAGLGFACKLKPGQADFLGKDKILAQRQEGWRKRLVSVRAASNAAVSLFGHDQELIYRDGELVGSLQSGCHSHTLNCAIGLGYVRGPPKVPQAWLTAGSYEVEAPTRDEHGKIALKRFPVHISTRCLVDPRGDRMRGEYAGSSLGLGCASDVPVSQVSTR